MDSGRIQQHISALAAVRRRYLCASASLFGLPVAVLILCGLWSPAIFILVFPVSIVFIVLSKFVVSWLYRRRFKKETVIWICNETDLSFSSNGFSNIADLYKHHILPFMYEGKIEDGFKGIYDGQVFFLQELVFLGKDYAERPPLLDDNARAPHNYRWVSILLKVKKHFSAHTVIVPDNMLEAQLKEHFAGLEKINIVSNQFEKIYDTLSTDQTEARVLLDPAVIEKLIHFRGVLNAKDMRISFLCDEVLILYKCPLPIVMVPTLAKSLRVLDSANPVFISNLRFFMVLEEARAIVDTVKYVFQSKLKNETKGSQ